MAARFAYRVILVGVDFSAPSRQALARAFDLARRLGARLEVAHVVQKLKPSVPFSQRNRAIVERLQEELDEQARERLEEFAPRSTSQVTVHTRVLSGRPDAAILAHAKRCKADLIVLASRGHSALDELLIGSTAERVLRATSLPVFLVSVPRPGRRD